MAEENKIFLHNLPYEYDQRKIEDLVDDKIHDIPKDVYVLKNGQGRSKGM